MDEKDEFFTDNFSIFMATICIIFTSLSNFTLNGLIFLHGLSDQGSRERGLIRRLTSGLSLMSLLLGSVFTLLKVMRLIQGENHALLFICPGINVMNFFQAFVAILTFDEVSFILTNTRN